MSQRERKVSGLLSLVLRHDPGAIGLELDGEGWAKVDELLACLKESGKKVDLALLERVVENNTKQRFTFSEDGARIRANQGHSVEIDLGLEEKVPPELLYHGTAVGSMEAIEREGLKKMTRQYVHLSDSVRVANEVGLRHGQPVILEIGTRVMVDHGFVFYQAMNGVWLIEHVPPDYLNRRFTI